MSTADRPWSLGAGNARDGPPLPLFSSGLSEAKKELRIDGQSLGHGTAFSAVALSQRPGCDAHQSKNIRERYSDRVPPGPNTWTLNIQPLGQFRLHRRFL